MCAEMPESGKYRNTSRSPLVLRFSRGNLRTCEYIAHTHTPMDVVLYTVCNIRESGESSSGNGTWVTVQAPWAREPTLRGRALTAPRSPARLETHIPVLSSGDIVALFDNAKRTLYPHSHVYMCIRRQLLSFFLSLSISLFLAGIS